MMRAIRPLWAPKRSASSDTLLALGSAAASVSAVWAKGDSGSPMRIAAHPASHTSTGWMNSLARAIGT